MSNNKQSSVDFYAEKSLDLFNLFQQGSISINDFRARMLIIEIEAKAMHKKEIKDAIYWGNIKGYDEHKRTWVFDEDEQYYNETFNTNEK
jgi:hypothetical protein